MQRILKKRFNKNLVTSAEDEERFQSSNKCWIWNKLFGVGDNTGRDLDHVTEKYRGSTHFRLTKKVVLFHNLRGCDKINYFII